MVLHVSIDGLRPDALSLERTPFLCRTIAEGRGTLRAQTVMPSVTLPCHNSMFRSVPPTRHGITTNIFTPLARPVPSLIDHAKKHGKRTGMVLNWYELRDLAEPWNVDVVHMNAKHQAPADDDLMVDLALDAIHHQQLDYLFVYLGHTDHAGHQSGWMSEPYLDAARNADACVQRLVAGATPHDPDLSLVWSADHGGHDRGHGTDLPEDMTIPFAVWGRGVAHGMLGEASIMDVAPTVMELLGLPAHEDWEGLSRAG